MMTRWHCAVAVCTPYGTYWQYVSIARVLYAWFVRVWQAAAAAAWCAGWSLSASSSSIQRFSISLNVYTLVCVSFDDCGVIHLPSACEFIELPYTRHFTCTQTHTGLPAIVRWWYGCWTLQASRMCQCVVGFVLIWLRFHLLIIATILQRQHRHRNLWTCLSRCSLKHKTL